MKRGEIYRTKERAPERGNKPGFYVVVSRSFIAENADVSTVMCAPTYSNVLGLATEVVVGPEDPGMIAAGGQPRRLHQL